MPRIRTVKPEFWTDSKIANLSSFARLLFIGMWNFADDYGVIEDDPVSLKWRVLPGDDVDAVGLVGELVAAGRVLRREAPDGTNVLVVANFTRHQKIDKRSVGRWGDPAEWCEETSNPPESPRVPPNPAEPSSTPAQNSPRKGKEGKGSIAPENGARKRDELWEAMIEACGLVDADPTSSERGAWNKAVAQMRGVKATPDEVHRRADAFRRLWPGVSLTPTALARRWNEVVASNGAAAGREQKPWE